MSLEQLHRDRPDVDAALAPPLTARALVVLALLVVGCALTYAATIGVSYLQNGLQAVPLSDIGSGAHDPKDQPFPPSATTAWLALLAVVATPLLSGVGALVAGSDVVHAVRRGRTRGHVAAATAVLALCVVVLLAYVAVGPITAWWLD